MKNYLAKRNNNYDLFDAFDDFFRPVFFDEQSDLKTNIKETDKNYELDIEMPGYNKDQIKVALENGYLTVSASKEKKEEDDKKHYVRKEISESCSRSYYVGEDVTQADIKAKYENGMLSVCLPKSQPKQIESKYIDIEYFASSPKYFLLIIFKTIGAAAAVCSRPRCFFCVRRHICAARLYFPLFNFIARPAL